MKRIPPLLRIVAQRNQMYGGVRDINSGLCCASLRNPPSGRQPLNGPPAVRLPRVAKPIVQAADAALPELDRFGVQAEAAPVWGKRDFPVAELLPELGHALFQHLAARN